MASIILSFVGSQDPYSDITNKLGSIASLVKHLFEQQQAISRVMLLHSEATYPNAVDTQDWLSSEYSLEKSQIEIIAINEMLSQDPINQTLAVQEVRKAIDKARVYQTAQDTLEFNASSGTPAMKSAWGILQVAGYAPQSHVWQVRNPDQMKTGQLPIFRDDVAALKNEFDRKMIQRQIDSYDYGAALVMLQESSLASPTAITLLQYGRCRLLLDFDKAYEALKPYKQNYPQLVQAVAALSATKLKDLIQTIPPGQNARKSELEERYQQALLQEAYFKALIRLKRQEYSDFLIDLFRFLESVPKFLVRFKVGLEVPSRREHIDSAWQSVRRFQQGQLYEYLQSDRFREKNLELRGFMNRYVLMAILSYFSDFSDILPVLERLNAYCDQRNDYVHGFRGISKIENQNEVLADLRKLLLKVTTVSSENPFDRLNHQICDLLDRSLQVAKSS